MEKRIILIFIITLCFILSVKGQNTSPIQKIKESTEIYQKLLKEKLSDEQRLYARFYYQFSLYLNNKKEFNFDDFLISLPSQLKKQNEDAFYAACLLAEDNYAFQNYSIAKSLSENVLSECKLESENGNTFIAWANSIKGSCMFMLFEDKHETQKFLNKAYSLFEPNFINEINARNLLHLGTIENALNNFYVAYEHLDNASNIYMQLHGSKNIDYISTLQSKAACLNNLGEIQKAINLEEEANLLLTTNFPDFKITIANSFNSLGTYYYENCDYNKAIKVIEEACSIFEQINENKNYGYARALSNLAFCKHALDLTYDAIEIEKKALKIRRSNNDSIEIASSLNNLGTYYQSIENSKEAIKYSKEALEINERCNNTYSNLQTLILDQLSQSYHYIGDYSSSILYGERSLNITKEIYGEEHIRFINVLGNLGIYYWSIGNNQKFEDYSMKALHLSKKVLGSLHPTYAAALGTNAIIMLINGNIEKAFNMTQEAIDIYKYNSLENTLPCRIFMTHLIDHQIIQKKYDEAIENIFQLLPQEKEQPINYIHLLLSLIKCYEFKNDYIKALEYSREHLSIIKDTKSNISETYAYGLEIQRNILTKLNLESEVINNYIEQFQCLSLYSYNNVLLFTENEKYKWWENINRFIQDMASFSSKTNNNELIYNLYQSVLLSKGILLNSNKKIYERLTINQSTNLTTKLNSLKKQKQYLNQNLFVNRISSVELIDNINTIEREILQELKPNFSHIENYNVKVSDVISELDNNEIAIEFCNIDSINHIALLLKKDWNCPKIIYLNFNNSNDKDHYNIIWKPIEEYISPGDNIYFSASGILHQIPIESLPIGDGKIMSDVYNIHRLSSTRELVKEKKEVKYTKAALYGGLNYDMTDNELLVENRTYSKNASEEYFVSRGLLEDSIRGYKWDNLSNTLQEVDYISDLMKKNQITTQTYKGNKGNEESFKALSGHEYNIIHLATHGFFYPDEEAKEKDYFKPMLLNDHYRMYNEVDMSMWRSGLVMSGGNRAWKGDTIPDTVEDGILKAQEIGDLDLRGADLVVLSACNTGQGEVTGEGVFGLQRAFKMAGAQTIIMSLTPVDDQTTMAMMNKFYTNLFSGQSKHDAFYNAQRYIRSVKPDPKYWMGWIMLD